MTFTLPFPPSVNRLYRTVRGRPILSAEARAYRSAAGMRCAAAGMRQLDGALSVTLTLYRPRRSGDVDGPVKLLLDCLEGFAYGNDGQIDELHVYRRHDKSDPRVEVEVSPLLTEAKP